MHNRIGRFFFFFGQGSTSSENHLQPAQILALCRGEADSYWLRNELGIQTQLDQQTNMSLINYSPFRKRMQ